MTAEIISVGTELLLGQITDTHAPTMARILAECGIGCQRRTTVGDNLVRLTSTIRESLNRADVVVLIGGLGPTMDDLTRDGIAAALDEKLVREQSYVDELKEWFEKRGIPFSDNNARQGDRPESGRFIDNPNGTAPGLLVQKDGKTVIALPGPKGEFDPMAKGVVREFLERLGGGVIHSRVLRVIGIGESYVETLLADLMQSDEPTVAPYAHTGEVHLRLTAHGKTKEEAEAKLEPVHAEIARRLGPNLFGTDDTTLEQSVVERLRAKGHTIGTAESMTGGQLASRFTNVPGSSEVFRGGIVAYHVDVKIGCLEVPRELLDEVGPVSSEVAERMALGAKDVLKVDWALSVTGNAGPASDIDKKPVGLVYIALAGPDGVEVREEKYRGVREDIQRRTAQTALGWLREKLG
ncbi:competence/damage-inducible protein A [bacterium]|nr:MAG: competence/damage-inducible protein A [bacterium]